MSTTIILSSKEANLRPAITEGLVGRSCVATGSSTKLTETASWTRSEGLRRTGTSVEICLAVFVPDEPSLGFEDANVGDFPHAVFVLALLAGLAAFALVDVQWCFHVAGPVRHL